MARVAPSRPWSAPSACSFAAERITCRARLRVMTFLGAEASSRRGHVLLQLGGLEQLLAVCSEAVIANSERRRQFDGFMFYHIVSTRRSHWPCLLHLGVQIGEGIQSREGTWSREGTKQAACSRHGFAACGGGCLCSLQEHMCFVVRGASFHFLNYSLFIEERERRGFYMGCTLFASPFPFHLLYRKSSVK